MRRSIVVGLASVLFLAAAPEEGRAGSLAEDGRAGTVAALQGSALVRPVGRERWTPLSARSLVFPGDVVHTEARGAHAVEIRFPKGGGVVLGPATYVEFPNDGGVRLLRGELEVKGPEGGRTQWLRASDRETTVLDAEPRWLTGYRSSTSEEWMGSLLATVSGKAVPLSIGYHKVTAEIRDQIARTTVEESFVNNTDQTLEGVFSFPLPAEASISGFGMWIGEELVEADVVERQRAREIYEDILRRKQDPGLLEWEGGNLFKARVYPIPPRGEKRIRLRYTEVLPLEGETYRWRYALRSELLRSHPLRELAVSVSVTSAATIADVTSPTHPVVVRKTDHEAVAEFGARSYVPDRDFEVAVTVGKPPPLSALAHRRGDDGFFMLLLSPTPPPEEAPAAAAGSRGLVPDGNPLDLLLVADTSGSMNSPSRAAQAAFLSALLAQLSEKDRFRLLAFDVEPRWLVKDALPATEENAAKALADLDARFSLGWTDLESAFDALVPEIRAGTNLVYVGDGVPTSGKADPLATADRLRAKARESGGTCHAVSVSASYEKAVLQAIASIGGGSFRRADEDPRAAATALLREIARPGLKDVKVAVTGIPTARVYPETLPNLPVGEQQIVLGRFLPGANSSAANVVVTGTLAGKPVRYETSFVPPAAEEGNSFLPRLWARRHLDALLAEGSSARVQQEIVGFSREYQILTPYTSFLVLENDQDRARYGVERTVHMRDAERFFAEAKEKATLEIARKQTEVARRWRLGLRRRMLREIEGLGRELPRPVAWGRFSDRLPPFLSGDTGVTGLVGLGARIGGVRSVEGPDLAFEREPIWLGTEVYLTPSNYTPPTVPGSLPEDLAMPPPGGLEPVMNEEGRPLFGGESERSGDDWGLREYGTPPEPDEPPSDTESDDAIEEPPSEPLLGTGGLAFQHTFLSEEDGDFRGRAELVFDRGLPRWPSRGAEFGPGDLGFPGLFPSALPPKARPDPAWDPLALRALRVLDRRPALATLTGALRVTAEWTRVHPVRGTPVDRARATALVTARRFLVRSDGFGESTFESWLSETERGVMDETFLLGRVRPAADADRGIWPLPIADGSLGDAVAELARAYRRPPTVARSADVVRITFRADANPDEERVLTVDLLNEVLLEDRTLYAGRTHRAVRYSYFVTVAGRLWATKVQQSDDEDHVAAVWTIRVEVVPTAAFDAEFSDAAAARAESVLHLPAQDPDATAAGRAVRSGNAEFFAEHVAVVCAYAAASRWDTAWKAWEGVERSAHGKPGLAWMRAALLARSRRGAEWASQALALARDVARVGGSDAPQRAWRLDANARGLGGRERLAVVEALMPVWLGASNDGDLWARWARIRHAAALQAAGEERRARAERAAIAVAEPLDAKTVIVRAWDLAHGEDDPEAAAAYLHGRIRVPNAWTKGELATLGQRWVDVLWSLRDLPRIREAVDAWLAASPEDTAAHLWRLTLPYLEGDLSRGSRAVVEAIESPLEPADPAREAGRKAAVWLAIGHAPRLGVRTVPTEFREPLAGLARRVLRAGRGPTDVVTTLLQEWRFRETDECRRLLDGLAAEVVIDLAELAVDPPPLRRIAATLPWIEWPDEATWRKALTGLLSRWRAEKDPTERETLLDLVEHMFRARNEPVDLVAFRRERLARVEARAAPRAAQALFDAILAAPHAPPMEDEAFALLPRLDPDDPSGVENGAGWDLGGNVRSLAAWVFSAREEAAAGTPEERAKRTRAEVAEAAKAARKKACEETAARFAAAISGPPGENARVRPWLEAERLGYAAETRADLARTEEEAEILLGSIAPDRADAGDSDLRLARRASLALAYAATRRAAPKGVPERVLHVLNQRLAANDRVLDARYEVFRLLVALDRVDELEEDLRGWVTRDDVTRTWRVPLAYVLAETGRVREAAEAMEAATAVVELTPHDWAALADWYLVLGEDAKRESALDRRYEGMDEWALSSRLWSARERLSRRGDGVPGEIEVETLHALRAYLSKTTERFNALDVVKDLYEPTKDFRVLEVVADGVLGRSPETLYAYLEQAAEVVGGIHEEAACDALAARIEALLAKAREPTDVRGLGLLLSAVEARAAAAPKADAKHGERAVAALTAALAGDALTGERAPLAAYLASLGAPAHATLSAEALRGAEALLVGASADPFARLAVGRHVATMLWERGRKDDATDRLTALVAAVSAAVGGTLPTETDDDLDTLLDWWTQAGRFRRAETFLSEALAKEKRSWRADNLHSSLLRLYADAFERAGATSLGEGKDLFEAAAAAMVRRMVDGPSRTVEAALATHARLHRAAAEKGLAVEPGERYERFAKERLPAILARAPFAPVEPLRDALGSLAGLGRPKAALEVAIDRLEAEPREAESVGRSLWPTIEGPMAEWRRKAGGIGALEPRLLSIILARLEQALATGDEGESSFWAAGRDEFWSERASDFARVAARVAQVHAGRRRVALRVARFQRGALGLHPAAISTLSAALAAGATGEDLRETLATWLVEDSRYEEARALLERLVEERPDTLEYRRLLARALHGVSRDEDALRVLEEAAARWKERKGWGPYPAHHLAETAFAVGLAKPAAAWLDAALAGLREAGGNEGPDGRLSAWYALLARARSQLGETDAAVRAAAAAVVAWGPAIENRRQALDALGEVLANAKDFDAWIVRYEAEAKETGLDAPTIRKAIGRLLLDRGRPRRALPHLTAARDLDPADAEAHDLLVAALDRSGDAVGAREALLASLATAPRNLDAYRILAQRFTEANDPENAERARTNLVEAMPSEPDGYRLLAEIREIHDRWALAVPAWEGVVRVRPNEPDGWMRLANAQAKAGDLSASKATYRHVLETDWDPRYGDVHSEAAEALR